MTANDPVDKKILGFDMDGVIIDHTEMKIRLARNFGWKLAPQHTQSEIIKMHLPQEIRTRLQMALYQSDEFAYISPLMTGVKDKLTLLKDSATPYFLISRRREPNFAIQLLEQRGLWPNFFNQNNAFFVKAISDKDEYATKLGVTHYVDDEMQVLDALKTVSKKYLFNPLEISREPGNYISVSSWNELASHIIG